MALRLGELSAVLSANLDPFKRDLARARQAFREHADQIKTTAATAGLAIAAALGAGLVSALDVDAAKTRLAAQLGGDAKYAEDMGRIAGRIYARGFGESAQAVGDALRAVLTSGLVTEGTADEVIEDLTVKAQSLAQVFDQDVTQAARAAGQMIRTGLAKDGQQAFDLLTRGFQESGDHAGDLLDTVSEYSTKFRDLGLDGSTALGLLSQGLKAGARDADTVADALKEFAIRAIDGSKASADGFRALGLDAAKMTAQIARGGDSAKAGLDVVLDRLRAIKDPVQQDAAAVALFGTKAEDLGDALYALDVSSAADQLGTVAGAADQLGKTLEESSSQKLEAFRRSAQAALADTMAAAIPYLDTATGFLSRHADIVGPLAVGLGALAAVIATVAAAMKVWAVVQTILNLALWTSPITWIVLGIVALVAVIVLIATKTTWFQDLWNWVWGKIGEPVKAIWNWIKDNWPLLIAIITGPFGWIVAVIVKNWDTISGAAKSAWKAVVNAAKSAWEWLKSLPGKIKDAFLKVGEFVSRPFRSGFNAVARAWNSTVGRLSWTVPSWVPGVGGRTISAPRLPMLARGGHIIGAGLAVVGEAGPELVHLGRGATVQPLTGGAADGHAEAMTLRLVIQTEDGRVIRERLIRAAADRGQTVAQYLSIPA